MDGAPPPWQVQPSSIRASALSQGGPLGFPKTGPTSIKERTNVSKILRTLRRIPSPDFFYSASLFESSFKASTRASVQISLMALFNPVIMAFPSPKSIMVLSM